MNKKYVFLLSFCALFFAYQYGMKSAIPNVLNENLQDYFGASASQIGFLVSLSYLAYTVMQIPTGLIMDRVSVKKIIVSSFALFACGLLALVSSSNYICAAISQVILGATSSFAFIMIMKVSNDYFPREKVALVSGLAISIGGIGPIICTPLIAHLSSYFLWHNIIRCFGALGILCSIIVFLGIKEKDLLKPEIKTNSCSIFKDIKTIISDYRYIVISIFSMATWGACSSFCDAWGVSFITHAYNIPKEKAAFSMSFAYVGMMVGSPVLAWLSEKLNSFKKVMLGAATCFVVCLSIISFTQPSVVVLCYTLFLMGASAMSQFLAFPAALSLCDKKQGATITGIVNMITMLGCTILVWVVGYILDWSKGSNLTYSAADYKCGMVALVLSILIAIFVLSFIELPTGRKKC